MRRTTLKPEIRSFVSVLRFPVTQPFDRGKTKSANFTKNGNCFEECNVLGNGKCELSAIQEGKTKVQIFGKEKCKTHRQFQRYYGDVTSVSLSLSHLAHNIGSASALPIIGEKGAYN